MRDTEHTPNPLVLGRKAPVFPAFYPRRPWIGGDLQTLRNTFTYRQPDFSPYPGERLLLPMGDGDNLWALHNRPREDTGKPVIVLIHGLTGSEVSRNIMTSAAYHLSRGYPVVRMNLRGAGPSLGHSKGHYHAGRSSDIRAGLAALPDNIRERGIFLVGVSLGGNVALKFLGENEGVDNIIGGASVCAPIDLKAAQLRIAARRNFIYQHHLLQAMRSDARAFTDSAVQMEATLARVKTVYDFDDLIVAPNNGFNGAEDYYRRSSAKSVLDEIKVPTLLVHPRTDPWVPASMYLDRTWNEDSALSLLMPPDGGHVGFHGRDNAQPWHDRCIGLFLDNITASQK